MQATQYGRETTCMLSDGPAHCSGRRYDTQTVSTRETVVRGQPTTLRILEGTDENGRKVRQVICGFSNKSGDILLAIVVGQDTWDQAMVDSFLQSIR